MFSAFWVCIGCKSCFNAPAVIMAQPEEATDCGERNNCSATMRRMFFLSEIEQGDRSVSQCAYATKTKDETAEQQKPRNGSDNHFCPRPRWRAHLGSVTVSVSSPVGLGSPTVAQQLPQDLTSRSRSTKANSERVLSAPPGDKRILERSAPHLSDDEQVDAATPSRN